MLHVGVCDHVPAVTAILHGGFSLAGKRINGGKFSVVCDAGTLRIDLDGRSWSTSEPIVLIPDPAARFTIADVVIGVQFHWERKETETFEGSLRVVPRPDGTLTVINDVPLEVYLTSVISSEMSAESPKELLRAHAITSRSWLVAMLERSRHPRPLPAETPDGEHSEIIRWYTREDHDIFDVCADDHCQRYQGTTKVIRNEAADAVQSTRGMFLVYGDEVCDARYYKACGGRTENFANSWEDIHVPYLVSVSDSPTELPPLETEEDAERWILSSPESFCNTRDPVLLKAILPRFDQETTDFFRWSVTYKREELEEILRTKSGFDPGTLLDLVPVKRGPSGRLVKLKVVGSKRICVVGKDLEIRRWLSPSHLYSSAFVVRIERDAGGIPDTVTLHGAGWGHGVGLCQIGAAVMAARGHRTDSILRHYFPGASVRKLY
jgi:SpoIID/LytB domain protein